MKMLPALFFFFVSVTAHGQTYQDKQHIVQQVFYKIIEAYGSSKPAPQLELLSRTKAENVIARYTSEPRPTVKIDEQLVDICLGLKADSLNALAIIISHELAHYYKEHNFCLEYAYAAGKRSPLYKEFVKYHLSDANKMEKEYQADEFGLFYASAAGYDPFNVFEAMINTVYKSYHLSDNINGYPSKSDRKKINALTKLKAGNLVAVFKAGNILTQVGEYEEAAACFDHINITFPGRENYNNAGVARLRAVLKRMPKKEFDFIYPIESDPVSRLRNYATRGINDEVQDITTLLQNAERDFEESIKHDRTYTNARINLACVLNIRGNYFKALGTLQDIPAADNPKYMNSINLLYGIIYFDQHDTSKAVSYFNKLPIASDSIMEYNRRLSGFIYDSGIPAMNIYKREWVAQNLHKAAIREDQQNFINSVDLKNDIRQVIHAEKEITILYDRDQNGMEILINEEKLLKAARYKNNEWIIKMEEDWMRKNNGYGLKMRVIQL